jgi:hypothetical protein
VPVVVCVADDSNHSIQIGHYLFIEFAREVLKWSTTAVRSSSEPEEKVEDPDFDPIEIS